MFVVVVCACLLCRLSLSLSLSLSCRSHSTTPFTTPLHHSNSIQACQLLENLSHLQQHPEARDTVLQHGVDVVDAAIAAHGNNRFEHHPQRQHLKEVSEGIIKTLTNFAKAPALARRVSKKLSSQHSSKFSSKAGSDVAKVDVGNVMLKEIGRDPMTGISQEESNNRRRIRKGRRGIIQAVGKVQRKAHRNTLTLGGGGGDSNGNGDSNGIGNDKGIRLVW